VGPATGTTTFALTSAGDRIFFGGPPPASQQAPATSLFASHAHASTPAEIVPSGFGGFYFPWENGVLGPSPDGSQVLYFSTESVTQGYLYSLSVVADAPGATPVAIDSTFTATIPADPFTSDSRYVIYLSQVSDVGTGRLEVWDIHAGKAVAVSAKDDAVSANALSGSQILFTDAYDGSLGASGVADLRVVDVASAPLHAVTIQSQADATYYLTPDRSRVVYTRSVATDAGANGIYVHAFCL
jgi:hypothetical protein